jgi:periplasmic protein TonB
MNYAQQQRDPRRHLFGIGSVILIHVIVVYALLNGLARKVVEVFKKPLEVSIIEEVKLQPPPPPPPPSKVLRPPSKVAPPPAYVPPPEVAVATPPANVVTAVTQAPPAPPAPPAPAVEAPRPAVVAVGIVCPNHLDVQSRVPYPAQAVRLGLSGEVEVEFIVSATGSVGEIGIVRSSNKVFNNGAAAAVAQFRCVGQGRPVKVRVPFVFRLDT